MDVFGEFLDRVACLDAPHVGLAQHELVEGDRVTLRLIPSSGIFHDVRRKPSSDLTSHLLQTNHSLTFMPDNGANDSAPDRQGDALLLSNLCTKAKLAMANSCLGATGQDSR